MAEHTPGPWTTDCTDGDGFAYIGSRDALVAIVQHGLLGSPAEAVAKANAHVLAASPELLEHGKALLEDVQALTRNDPTHFEVANVVALSALRLGVAIAKAERR